MDISILIAACALGLSAITFTYKLGRDTKSNSSAENGDESKLDQIYTMLETANKKIDKIVDWQREAAAVHEKHGEQIKTLFHRMERVEARMEDRETINAALAKILEKVG